VCVWCVGVCGCVCVRCVCGVCVCACVGCVVGVCVRERETDRQTDGQSFAPDARGKDCISSCEVNITTD